MSHSLSEKLKKGPSPLPAALISSIVFIATLLMWQAVLSGENTFVRQQVFLQASNVRERVHEQVQMRMLALQRMAKRWENMDGTPRQLWEDDAWANYRDFGGFRAIEWVDPTFRVQWIVPLQGNEAAMGLDLGKEERRRNALIAARDTRQPSVTRPIDLAMGGKGFHAYIPLYVGERFDGFIVGVFRVDTMLNSFLDPSKLDGYGIALREGGEDIYTSIDANRLHEPDLGTTLPFDLLGNAWELRVWPEPATVDMQHTSLPAITLLVGMFFTLVLGLAVYFAQVARHRAQSVIHANLALKIEVTERKYAEATLQQQRDFDQQILNTMGQGLTVLDGEGRFEYVNPAYAAMLGREPEDLIGTSPSDFTYTGDLSALEQARSRRAKGEKSTYETKLRRADGTPIHAHITGVPRFVDGQIVGAIAVITDLSERKKLEQALHELSTRDELTGLYNRRAFNGILQEEVSRHDHHSCPVSLALLDVDYFKKVNDTYGHQVGDEVLRWIARLVMSNVRAQDRVARFGGEELAIVLPETCEEEAREIAERLRQAVAATDFVLTQGVRTEPVSSQITVSLGVATLNGGDSLDSLISAADEALYKAKHAGRNRVVEACSREQETKALVTSDL